MNAIKKIHPSPDGFTEYITGLEAKINSFSHAKTPTGISSRHDVPQSTPILKQAGAADLAPVKSEVDPELFVVELSIDRLLELRPVLNKAIVAGKVKVPLKLSAAALVGVFALMGAEPGPTDDLHQVLQKLLAGN